MSVTRNEIHHFIKLNSLSIHKKEDSILVYNFIKEHDLKFQGKKFESQFHLFISEYGKKWTRSKRTDAKFIRKNSAWLENDFNTTLMKESKNKQLGRPTLPFEDSSSKTKKRKVATLSASNSCELLFASGTHLWKEGRRKDAQIAIKLADNKDAELDHSDNTSEEALALLLDNEKSKSQYQRLRNNAKSKKSNLYPPYNDVREAKERCLPSRESWAAADYFAGINFQALVDHTVLRLLEVQHDVINSFVFDRLILRSKIGFDGSTGQSIYTQVTDELENRSFVQEASLFLTCFVPLELTGFSGQVGKIVWRNPHPSSTLYCQIVRFRFVKETTDVMNAEHQFLENAIGNLTTTPVPKYENLTVLHKVDVTMIDGK